MKLLDRPTYLKQLIEFKDSQFIKVIIGVGLEDVVNIV